MEKMRPGERHAATAATPTDGDAPRETACRIVARLQHNGFTAYWAGGCVRDMLLDRVPKDYDIATNATPDEVERLFNHTHFVGKSFGVSLVEMDDTQVEVATFRRESGYTDGRRPSSITFTDAEEDARRRDFTVNAMFFDPTTDTLHDFVDGKQDIEARIVRCVGNPQRRFDEDYLRMLRAVRFAATLEFSLHADTAQAIRERARCIRHISAERVRDELTRILLEAPEPGQAIRLLHELGLLEQILPEVAAMGDQEQPADFHPEGDVLTHTVMMLDSMPAARDLRLAFSVLLHDVGKPATAVEMEGRIRFHGHEKTGATLAETILRRLRFSQADIEHITHCVANHMTFMNVPSMRTATRRRLIGSPTFATELELHRLDCEASHGMLDHHRLLVEQQEAMRSEPILPPPWVTGHDILALGTPPGRAIGRLKQQAYDAQLEGRFASREELLDWLRAEQGRH